MEPANGDFKIPKTGSPLKGALVYTILRGDQKKASEILHIVGANVLIRGTNWTTLDKLCEFYNVTHTYARGVINSHGITSVKCRDSVLHMTCHGIRKRSGIKDLYAPVVFEDGKNAGIDCMTRLLFYDSRVVLAFACLAFMHRKIVPDSNAKRILEIIEKSEYQNEAKELLEWKKNHPHDAEPQGHPCNEISERGSSTVDIGNTIVPPMMESHIRLNEAGEVTISLEVFAKIIQALVSKI